MRREAGLEGSDLGELPSARQGAGIGVLHDFSLPWLRAVKVLPDQLSLTRSFYLVRHADDRRLERQNRFAAALVEGLRAEVARLESEA